MKKLLAILLTLVLLGVCALAENIDWSSMSDDEIKTAIKEGQAELDSRKEESDDGSIVAYDKDGHKLTLSNMHEGNYINYGLSLVFDAIYENNSDGTNELVINGSYVNGWDTGALRSPDTTPGHKEKLEIVIGLDDTDVKSLEEIETIELVFGYMDKNYHFTEFDPVTIYQK